MWLVTGPVFDPHPPQCQGPGSLPTSLPTCSHVHASWFGKYLYMCSRSKLSILLHSSRNLGQRRPTRHVLTYYSGTLEPVVFSFHAFGHPVLISICAACFSACASGFQVVSIQLLALQAPSGLSAHLPGPHMLAHNHQPVVFQGTSSR